MSGCRTILLPATPLVLRQYAGPLWRGIPLAECAEAELPHPQLPPRWVLTYADWRERASRGFDRRMEAFGRRLPDNKPLRYLIGLPVLAVFIGLLLAALAAGVALSPVLGLGWLGARLVGGAAGGWRYLHTLGFLLTADVGDLKHYDAPTNYPAEDVPAAIAEARSYGYRVAVYALPTTSAVERQLAEKLVAEGRIDAFWGEPLPLDGATFAVRYGVNVANSVAVAPTTEIAAAWQQRGFDHSTGGRCTIWQPEARAAAADSVEASNEAYARRQPLSSHLHNPFPDILHVAGSTALPHHHNDDDDVVLYLEPATTPPAVRAFFRQNEAHIRAALAAEGKHFLRWPDEQGGVAPDAALLTWLRYAHPTRRDLPAARLAAVVQQLVEVVSAAQFAEAVLAALDLPTLDGALWLRAVPDFGNVPCVRAHRFVPPPELAGGAIDAWLTDRLARCLPLIGRHPLADVAFSFGQPPKDEMARADWRFPDEGQRLPPELVAQIAALKAAAPAATLLTLLLHVADHLAETYPAVKQALLPLQPIALPAPGRGTLKLSPLVIDAQHRLWLPLFGNLEIKLTPLPKTLFLFFLQQPADGLMFHDLIDHQVALRGLYQQLQPDLDAATIRARIADLVDVRGNSINEKCSSIKEAFVREMADDIARHYYITGHRGGPKAIQLSRELVQWAAPA